MAGLGDFNARSQPPSAGFEPLPVGPQVMCVRSSERKQTASKDGEYLKLTFEVLDGTHKGRKLFKNLNLWNKSEEAVRIARGEMTAICVACNRMDIKDSCELHDIPVIGHVVCKKRKDTDEIQNEINKFEPKTAGSAPAAIAGATSDPPWMQKR